MKALLIVALVFGCAGTDNTVQFSEKWNTTRTFSSVHESWQRSDTLTGYPETVADAVAVLKTPEWWAAYTNRLTKVQLYSDVRAKAFLSEVQKNSKEYVEVHLYFTTYHRRENKLQSGDRAPWKMLLSTADGIEHEPISVTLDRRPRSVIRSDIPGLKAFSRPYIVRFPAIPQLMSKDNIALTIHSPRGAIQLKWVNKN